MYRIAFRISRKSTAGLRPRGAGLGISGAIRSHSASVRSDGYRLGLRAMSAIRTRLYIPSLNHNLRAATTSLKQSLRRAVTAQFLYGAEHRLGELAVRAPRTACASVTPCPTSGIEAVVAPHAIDHYRDGPTSDEDANDRKADSTHIVIKAADGVPDRAREAEAIGE